MRKCAMVLLVAILLLTACQGDKAAIDRAQARRIEQQARDESAARQAEEARQQSNWETTRQTASFAKQVLALIVVITLAVSLAVLVYRFYQVSNVVVVYARQRAKLAAMMVHVNPQTLTWPALVMDGAVHNLETAEVYRLGAPRPADPQQVTGDVLIRALSVGARGAERIGRVTEDGQSATAIPSLAGALPLVLRPTVPNTMLETVDLE